MNRIISVAGLLIALCLPFLAAAGWQEIGAGPGALNADSAITSITVEASGHVYAAGQFTNTQGKHYVATWGGSAWMELGTGSNALNANAQIACITSDKTGNIYAAGYFTNASGKCYVACWNGSTWAELGTGANALNSVNGITRIVTDSKGNVYACNIFDNLTGQTTVAKWNGTTWSKLGTGPTALHANGSMHALACDPNDNIYVAGGFTDSSGKPYVARWDGTSWSAVGTGSHAFLPNGYAILSLAVGKGQHLFATGFFTNAAGKYYVAEWDGTSWNELPNGTIDLVGPVFSLATDSKGSVYAAMLPGTGSPYVAKWTGATWLPVGTGATALNANNFILTLAFDTDDNLYAAGAFTNGPTYTSGTIYVAAFDHAGSVSAPAISLAAPVILLYPNPAGGYFTIQGNANAADLYTPISISLSNMLGQQVYQASITPTARDWKTTLFAEVPGIYQVKVTVNGLTTAKTVLIQH